MKSLPYYFEDFEADESFITATESVIEDSIVRFAQEWDPQDFHLDKDAAAHSIFGGLIASGLHVLDLSFRLYNDLGLMRGTGLAGLGISELRWLKPVHVGDSLHVVIVVLSKRRTRHPERGLLVIRLTTFNQAGEMVMTADISCLIKCRNPSAPTLQAEAAR